jgi:hypothetical protein
LTGEGAKKFRRQILIEMKCEKLMLTGKGVGFRLDIFFIQSSANQGVE